MIWTCFTFIYVFIFLLQTMCFIQFSLLTCCGFSYSTNSFNVNNLFVGLKFNNRVDWINHRMPLHASYILIQIILRYGLLSMTNQRLVLTSSVRCFSNYSTEPVLSRELETVTAFAVWWTQGMLLRPYPNKIRKCNLFSFLIFFL